MKIKEKLNARNDNARESDPVLITCLGDSVTHGYFELRSAEMHPTSNCRPWKALCMKLQLALTERFPVAAPTVMNAGIGGDGIDQMTDRLDRDVLRYHPDLVILEAGLNNCICEKTQEQLDVFISKVARLMDRVLETGAEMILLTPNMMCPHLHESVTPDEPIYDTFLQAIERQSSGWMDRYIEALRVEAKKRGIPVADAYAHWKALDAAGEDVTSLLANRINHPAPAMHDIFVEKIMEQILM